MPRTPAVPHQIFDCIFCGEPMWMTEASRETYKRNGGTFYCTHGHGQCFAKGETEADKLRRERDALKQREAYYEDQLREARESAEKERRRANGYKGHATKITKRAKAGVCPCCNRSFENLRRHMASKHPTFTPMELEDRPGVTVQ
jgi:hypothetical protein